MLEFVAQMLAAAQGLFGRVTGPELLEQPMRRRLLQIIEEKPGIHASELCRASGEPWGTVQYHLSLLHKGELVTTVEAGRERRFFPHQVDLGRARLLAILHQGRRIEIATFIQGNPGARQVDICDALSLSRKTFRHAIEPLVEEGLVQERKGLSFNRYFPEQPLGQALEAARSPLN